ncbi:MAG: TetR family transcriptional regulator [Actinomycetota bacterium]|nr:TetR family transcriptional regulator [Actinomycetota bacterium]MED6328671.1 TetR family transcriptional regulator [Actinomycetota bacterium]
MTATEASTNDPDLRASDGRVPGRRGLATRQRLLGATRTLLDTVAYRDLKVVDIAREAGTSPATFYQYFPDVESAMLALAGDLGQAWHEDLTKLVTNRDWAGDPDGSAHCVADGMLEFWTRHKPVLRVLDLGSMEGDFRFRDIRTFLLAGATQALTDLATSRDCPGDPQASAGVVVGMLAHVANHQHGLERWGVTHEQLVDTVAGIIRRSIVGGV